MLYRKLRRAKLPRDEAPEERRRTSRLPIRQEVRYSVLGERKKTEQIGLGSTLNMSSGGVLFTTESVLPEGERIELAVSWPAQLDGVSLKLVLWGRLVRAEDMQAAMSIERYEFKTRGSGNHRL